MRMVGRREFLRIAGALGVSSAIAADALTGRTARFDSYPFSLGVASGYPSADGFVLWTRLATRPAEPGGGLAPEPLPVRLEIADDDSFRKLLATRTEYAGPEWAHSIHAEVSGLHPERWYFYRFIVGDAVSPVGRTRTAPAATAVAPRLRVATASCQQFEQGYFSAYRHIVADDPDLMVFLGDYIYESSWGRDHVRKHDAPEPHSLDDYRARHALYKSDPDLQAAHAALPWVLTWDDHEVENDYADDLSQFRAPKEQFLMRRAAAYQAYYEHLPLPGRMRPNGPRMRIHTEIGWGSLARFYTLDARQYRSWHACRRLWRRGEGKTVDTEVCPELGRATRSMLGRAQERWLEAALAKSDARWNLLAQPTPMAQFDQKPGPGRRAWTDGWDGYPTARKRLLDFLSEQKIANPVVLGGDVHAFNVNDLKRDFDDPGSPVVASEFVSSSITSQAWAQEKLAAFLPDNPHMKFTDSRFRGYLRMDLAPGRCVADLRAMESVQARGASCTTLASFVVEDGKPGALRA